jgi:rRNA maturation endonuclease Nob1
MSRTRCAECHYRFEDEEPAGRSIEEREPCPICGSTARNYDERAR